MLVMKEFFLGRSLFTFQAQFKMSINHLKHLFERHHDVIHNGSLGPLGKNWVLVTRSFKCIIQYDDLSTMSESGLRRVRA